MFNGDAVGADQMNDPNFDLFGKWFPNHGVETVRRPLDAVIAGLKREGITKFFGSGYCFGARYVVDLILEVRCFSYCQLGFSGLRLCFFLI